MGFVNYLFDLYVYFTYLHILDRVEYVANCFRFILLDKTRKDVIASFKKMVFVFEDAKSMSIFGESLFQRKCETNVSSASNSSDYPDSEASIDQMQTCSSNKCSRSSILEFLIISKFQPPSHQKKRKIAQFAWNRSSWEKLTV